MRRAAAAGLMGAGIGGLLVIDTTIGWGTPGSLAAITLIPSTIGGFWGGVHLWRFHEKLPLALTGVPVEEGDRLRFRGPAMETFTGALARLVGVTAVLSAAVLVAVPHVSDLSPSDSSAGMYPIATVAPLGLTQHSLSGPFAMTPPPAPAPSPAPFHEAAGDNQAGDMALLLGFGLVALATLLIGLLQSLGRPSPAVLSLVCGLAAEIGVQIWGVSPVPGVGLVVGALVAVIVALPPAISLFLRPGRALATTMWIQ
ncbi:MAG: hypothetical protein H0V22_10495 [Solirubrobacterales bacterium]|nr:hypothetical protein [Solirubrobacterales bacterium]